MKRATIKDNAPDYVKEISIHALVKRATEQILKYVLLKNEFQSTPS